MDDDKLHMNAAGYATNRREAYENFMKKGLVDKATPDQLRWVWLAHYEGYREGYWVATGDTRFSTDPGKMSKSKKGA